MTDLDALRQRHLRPEQMQHRTFYEGHIVIDLAALVEEVEHLRQSRDQFEGWLRERTEKRIQESRWAWEAADGDGVAFAVSREACDILGQFEKRHYPEKA